MSEPIDRAARDHATGDREPAVLDSHYEFRGKIISLRQDTIALDDGPAVREIVENLGAVVVVALDEDENVVIVNQYRHAVRARLDELPAGLLDLAGEDPAVAAARELAEEAALQAGTWHVLLDLHASPGFSDESVRVFLARDLSDAARPDGFAIEHEEATMTVARVPLDDAVRRTLAGTITNAAAVAGILATAVARADGYRGLRAADAPWPSRVGGR